MISTILWPLILAVIFGAVSAFSPTRAGMTVLMLGKEPRPWRRAIAYGAGNSIVYVVVVGMGLLGNQLSTTSGEGDLFAVLTGIGMLGLAALMLVRRRRGEPQIPDEGSGHPAAIAFAIGASMAVRGIPVLLALAIGAQRIGVAAPSVLVALLAAVVLLVIAQSPIWGLLLLSAKKPDRFAAVERRLGPTLSRVEDGPYTIVVVAAIGAYMLISGILG
jgi:Sap, sulfolipid-1-addressing protein